MADPPPARQVTVTYQAQDFVEAPDLHARDSVTRGRTLFTGIVAVLGVTLAIVVLTDWPRRDLAVVTLLLVPALVFGAGWVIAARFNRINGRGRLRQQAAARVASTFTRSEAGITICSDLGETRMKWGDYHRIVMGERARLLCHDARVFNSVPLRVRKRDQIADIVRALPPGTSRDLRRQ